MNIHNIPRTLRRLWYTTRSQGDWLAMRRSWHLTASFVRRQMMLAIIENAPTPRLAVKQCGMLAGQTTNQTKKQKITKPKWKR